jgi:hypothetical protein
MRNIAKYCRKSTINKKMTINLTARYITGLIPTISLSGPPGRRDCLWQTLHLAVNKKFQLFSMLIYLLFMIGFAPGWLSFFVP